MNKTATRAFAYSALIFIGGLATGLLTAPIIGRSFMRPPSGAQMANHIISMLESRLSLSAEQSAKVKPLVDKAGEDIEAIRLETANSVAARVEQTNEQIAALLTPEQKPKLEALAKENRERRRNRPP